MIVMAKTTPDAGHNGISAFIVPTETDGFEVGRDIEKMGLRASPTAEINISDARVPDDYLVGRRTAASYN